MRGNLNSNRSAVPACKGKPRNDRRKPIKAREARHLILNGTLPPGSIVHGSITFRNVEPIIPAGVFFDANLTLHDCGPKTKLGSGIHVKGSADFTGSEISIFPKRFRAYALDVSGTNVRFIMYPSVKVEILQVDARAPRKLRALAMRLSRENHYTLTLNERVIARTNQQKGAF